MLGGMYESPACGPGVTRRSQTPENPAQASKVPLPAKIVAASFPTAADKPGSHAGSKTDQPGKSDTGLRRRRTGAFEVAIMVSASETSKVN